MKDLNLLDPTRIQRIAQVDTLRVTLQTSVTLLSILIFGMAGLLYSKSLLQKKASDYEGQLQNTRVVAPSGKDLPIAETTKRVNKRLAILKPILAYNPISQRIQDIVQVVPSGVHLTGLSIFENTKNVSLKGFAETRGDIPLLQQAFDGITFLTNVSTKSNINERTNVQFELTATYVQETGTSK
jgi:Tfp pilus assembly protein PilN